MDEEKTFDLDDLDDEFWKKVVFFEIQHSSGLGGPGALWMVTEDKKKYCLGFQGLPFSEYDLADNLHPMFLQTNKLENGHHRYVIEDDWHYIHGPEFHTTGAMIRDDIYAKFIEIAKDENLIKEKVEFGYYNLPDIVGLALGTESLERIDYINFLHAREEEERRIKEINEEHEKNKLLPEHLIWNPMYMNNMIVNPILGEYALIVKRNEEKLAVMKFTIIFQPYHVKPMQIDLSKGPERYILFEKTYHDFYGPIDFSSDENKWENQSEEIEAGFQTSRHVLAFFDWACLSDGDYGMFLCSFLTEEEAKEYALCYANANSHITGNRNTLITHLEPKEDHQRRVERYEAYQAYRKYYKEIMDVIVNFEGYPDYTSGGAPFLKEAILKEVPQITERQLTLVWRDLPIVLEKRTQDVIEMERQNSMVQLQKIENGDK